MVVDESPDVGGARKVDTDKVRPIPRSAGVRARQPTEAVSYVWLRRSGVRHARLGKRNLKWIPS